jgi:pimeloyl-ACP methyl ester carboxylesterase
MRCFIAYRGGGLLRYHDLPGQTDCPLVFIHGLGCASSCDYPRVAVDPALANRRKILVDLLGSGFSDRPAEFPYTVEAHARCVAELIEALDVPQADLFGHSAGGAVAIETAAQSGVRVRRMILSEPNLDPGGGIFSCRIASQSEADFVAGGHARLVREALDVGDPVWAGSLAVSSPLALHRMSVSLVLGSIPPWREKLISLAIPRTVIFAERSLPDPDVERLAAAGIDVRIVPDAGHSMATENPAGLAAVIGAALKG